MTFIIKKLEIKKGKYSSVSANKKATGPGLLQIDKVVTDLKDLNEIQIGSYVLIGTNIINFIKTSEIKKINEVSDNKIIFETTSSIYEINKVEEK